MTDSVHGKTELSLRRKKSNVPASQSPTISSDIKFAHQLNAGETTIPLDALVQPVQMPAFVNPSAEKIAQANVKANASNLILVSSIKGTLMCDLSYKVISNTQINLEFAAEANEIITGQFRSTRGSDDLLEGRLWSVSGTLSAGNTDFALGQSFNTNANPNYQIGEVVVFIDGVQQFRNVDNAAAAPAADGNYEEVDAGGVFNLIRFNQAFLSDVAVVVMPANYIVTTSDLALQPQLDALAGQIDQMIPTLAAVAGVPETEFQGQPNNVDLKSFGDKVQQNRNDIDSNDVDIANLQANKQDAFSPVVVRAFASAFNFSVGSWGSNTIWSNERQDTHNALSGKTFTVPAGKSGWYRIHARITINDSSVGFLGYIEAQAVTNGFLNGAENSTALTGWGTGDAYPYVDLDTIRYLNAGDEIEIWTFQNSGPSRSTLGDNRTHLEIFQLTQD
jgi:hypothetical protein